MKLPRRILRWALIPVTLLAASPLIILALYFGGTI